MKHLGDITKMKRSKTPVVDCVTFGSPCQDLSIAGKRAGLAGERSGLFMEAVRVIREMRKKSNGEYPRFAVWENVVGAFSSNKGQDFRVVLEELSKIKEAGVSIPRPKNGRWAKSGYIRGSDWSLAWRTIDAQYWGVPQRRRRIAVVVDFGGHCAGEVLFECKGLPGYSEPSVSAWKGVARNPADCTAGHDSVVGSTTQINDKATRWRVGGSSRNHDGSGNGLGIGSETDPMFTLTAGDRHAVLCRASSQVNAETYIDCSPTITACHDGSPIVFENHSQDARYTQQGDTAPTCVACWGGNNMPLVAHPVRLRWIVRRLTPTECERLQGFPDGWTDIGEWVDEAGKKHKPADSPRYKALGNSIALPQWWWLTCKMAKYLPEHASLGSLFDGIGGFPLVWETYHGKGTAVWASEIEQFPIAVTKKHFPEEE